MLMTESLGLLVHTAPVDDTNNPVLEVFVTLKTERIGLLVCTVPFDEANNTVLDVIQVGICSV